jgi:hypothetical protein
MKKFAAVIDVKSVSLINSLKYRTLMQVHTILSPAEEKKTNLRQQTTAVT